MATGERVAGDRGAKTDAGGGGEVVCDIIIHYISNRTVVEAQHYE